MLLTKAYEILIHKSGIVAVWCIVMVLGRAYRIDIDKKHYMVMLKVTGVLARPR